MRSRRFHEPVDHILVVVAVPVAAHLTRVILELSESLVQAARSGRDRLVLSRPPEIPHSVNEDGSQPASKRACSLVLFELRQVLHNGDQDFLDNVVNLGMLDLVLTQPAFQERRVQPYKPLPRLGIG